VISALVHLTAVGLFRAAEERSRAREAVDSRRIGGIVELIPRFFPPPTIRNWSPVPVPPATNGVFTPVDRIARPEVEITKPGAYYPPETAAPSQGGDGKDGPDIHPGPPRDEPMAPFTPVDTPPTPLQAPRPPYPEWAREAGIEGTVVLKVLVGVDGIPKQVEILRGPKGLRDEAAHAVSRWTFTPGLASHRPVEVWVEVPVVFTLQ
jgi:protein TonB